MTALQEIEYLALVIGAGIEDLVQWLREQVEVIGDVVFDACVRTFDHVFNEEFVA